MQAEMGAVGAHTLGRFPVDRGDGGLLPVVLFAIGLGTDVFEGQRTFDEHHLAVTFVRNTLRIQIKRFNLQPVGGECGYFFYGIGHPAIVSAQQPLSFAGACTTGSTLHRQNPKAAEQAIQPHPWNWLCQATGCAPLAQQRGAPRSGIGGAFIWQEGIWRGPPVCPGGAPRSAA